MNDLKRCPTCGWPTNMGIPETKECDGQAICPTCKRMRNVYFANEDASGFVPYDPPMQASKHDEEPRPSLPEVKGDEVGIIRQVCRDCMDNQMPLTLGDPSCKGCPDNQELPEGVEEALDALEAFTNDNRPRHWKIQQLNCAVAHTRIATLRTALTALQEMIQGHKERIVHEVERYERVKSENVRLTRERDEGVALAWNVIQYVTIFHKLAEIAAEVNPELSDAGDRKSHELNDQARPIVDAFGKRLKDAASQGGDSCRECRAYGSCEVSIIPGSDECRELLNAIGGDE